MTPFLYNSYPTELQTLSKSIYGREVCGKKHPAFTKSVPEYLSKVPISLMKQSGSIKKETEGAFTSDGFKFGGAASITPPS